MTNELMGIIGVALFTAFLFLLQHAICILGRSRRRTHGTYIMPLIKTDKTLVPPLEEKPKAPGKLYFLSGVLHRGEAWFASAHGAAALPLALPQTRRRSTR